MQQSEHSLAHASKYTCHSCQMQDNLYILSVCSSVMLKILFLINTATSLLGSKILCSLWIDQHPISLLQL